jgi:hypothetical protein
MSEERDYEAEALADGWNPEFDGPGKKDAKTFVEDGEKISGMLKSKIGRLEERIDSLTHTNAEFKQYTDKQIKRERKEKETAIADLERVKAQAITDGDGLAAVQAEREINTLQSEEAQSPNEAMQQMSQQWVTDNPWYASNQKLGRFADGIADQIISQGFTGQAYFNELTRQVKDVFPEEFENPNRKKAGSVEGGGDRTVDGSEARTWANLPKEAKDAAKRFEKDIPGFKREDYLSTYEWE